VNHLLEIRTAIDDRGDEFPQINSRFGGLPYRSRTKAGSFGYGGCFSSNGTSDGLEQVVARNRLAQVRHQASGGVLHRDVERIVSREDDGRDPHAVRGETPQQLCSVHLRHVGVEEQAIRARRPVGERRQELPAGRVDRRLEIEHATQTLHADADRGIVVHDRDRDDPIGRQLRAH
jgi:hypothetical protein